MNIVVIGAGYVGLVTGACFAELGNNVICVDVNAEKVANLRKGIMPIYEPGLEPMVLSNLESGRLQFICNLQEVPFDPEVVFIAVGTPSDKDGSADILSTISKSASITVLSVTHIRSLGTCSFSRLSRALGVGAK